MPQTPSTFIPDDNPLPKSFIPDPVEQQQVQQEQPSLISRLYNASMTPLLPEVENTSHSKFDLPNSKLFQSIWPGGFEIPNARDVYNEVIRPISAPLGMLAAGAGAVAEGPSLRTKYAEFPSVEQPKAPIEEPPIAEVPKPKLKITAAQAAANLKESGSLMPKTFIPDEIADKVAQSNQLAAEANKFPDLTPSPEYQEGAKKLNFTYEQGKGWTRNAPKPVADEIALGDQQSLGKKLVSSEEGTFDPTEITRKIRTALDDAKKKNNYSPNPEDEPVIGKLLAAIEDAKDIRGQQADLYSAERARRIASAEDITGGGEKGFYARLAQLKGELPKIGMPKVQMQQADLDNLFNIIDKSSNLRPYEKINAQMGLVKLIGKSAEGELPQPSELAHLDKVFGNGFTGQIQDLYAGLKPPIKAFAELNAFKTLRASMDLSAPLRQGVGLIYRPEYWKSMADMVKAVGPAENYNQTIASIMEKPLFRDQLVKDAEGNIKKLPSFAKQVGLKITDLNDYNDREEQFISKLAEKVPGVTRSERAYLAFLNKLRADTFENMMGEAEKAGLNPKNNLVLSKALATYINNATGRGSLGKMEQNAVLLNNMFFSPRLVMSRLNMLNPMNYATTPKFVRMQYWKSLAGMAALGSMTLALAKLGGAEVNTDPTNSDFMKAKIGNTRLDPWAGFQQYAVLASRLATNQETSSTTGKSFQLGSRYGLPTRKDVIENFTTNKLSPAFKVAYDWYNQSKNRPFDKWQEGESLVVPMVVQDILDLSQEDPKDFPFAEKAAVGGLGALGMGVQTYGAKGQNIDGTKALINAVTGAKF